MVGGRLGEPGLLGKVTPVLPVRTRWQEADADAFWGLSVHWNTFLNLYVVLLNHACCEPGWPQEGIYVVFSNDIGNPETWTQPRKILDGVGWYPRVLGLGPGESDKLAGHRTPLFVDGQSRWTLTFDP